MHILRIVRHHPLAAASRAYRPPAKELASTPGRVGDVHRALAFGFHDISVDAFDDALKVPHVLAALPEDVVSFELVEQPGQPGSAERRVWPRHVVLHGGAHNCEVKRDGSQLPGMTTHSCHLPDGRTLWLFEEDRIVRASLDWQTFVVETVTGEFLDEIRIGG